MKTILALLTLVLVTGFSSDDSWTQLFNGKDLTGWEQVGPGSFVVEDGLLKTVGGMGMILYPSQMFGDVVIRVVFKVKDNDCNSGVFIRIPEKPADEWVAVNKGYEVQIDNGIRHVGGEYHCTGVLYSQTKAMAHPQKPVGEWNTMEITLDGDRTIVTVNDVKVTDFKEGDPVPAKTRDFEPDRGPRPLKGYIGLQNHDSLSVVYFKEVAVRPL